MRDAGDHEGACAQSSPSRRTLLAAGALLPLAAGPALAKTENPDAELIRLSDEIIACEREWEYISREIPDDDDDEYDRRYYDAFFDRVMPLLAKLERIPATTERGICAIATALAALNNNGDYSMEPDDWSIWGRLSAHLIRQALKLKGFPVGPSLLELTTEAGDSKREVRP